MAKIRKGDLVQVITGPTQDRGGDRGKQGRVLEIFKDRDRVLVEGINFVTKHSRVGQTQRGTKTGGIETFEGTSWSRRLRLNCSTCWTRSDASVSTASSLSSRVFWSSFAARSVFSKASMLSVRRGISASSFSNASRSRSCFASSSRLSARSFRSWSRSAGDAGFPATLATSSAMRSLSCASSASSC